MERELLLAAKNGDVRLLKRTLNIPNINVNCLDEVLNLQQKNFPVYSTY